MSTPSMIKQSTPLILTLDSPGEQDIFTRCRVGTLPVHVAADLNEELAFAQHTTLAALVISATYPSGLEVIASCRNHPYTAQLPIIAVILPTDDDLIADILSAGADEWLSLDMPASQWLQRIELARVRKARDLGMSPLTHLPGNSMINQVLTERLKKPYALLYCDIDNFKLYNDRYGFIAGDRILQFTARLLSATLNDIDSAGFLGHIGGDDFVVVTEPIHAQKLAQLICERFDAQIMKNMTLSIALVIGNLTDDVSHLSSVTSELKRKVKEKRTDQQSRYVTYQEVPFHP